MNIDAQVTDSEIEMKPPVATSTHHLSSYRHGLREEVKSEMYDLEIEMKPPSASVTSPNGLNPSLSNTKSDVSEFPIHTLKQFQVCIVCHICDWICKKESYMCNYKYLEIRF